MKGIAFKDRVAAHVYAGDGGDGCCSFRREKCVDKGGPDGGDGGHGGSVYLKASKDVDSLVALYYQPHQRAGHGGHGKGAQRTGLNGGDLIIPVPCGTQAWELPGYANPTEPNHEAEAEAPKQDVFSAEREYLGEVVNDGDTLLVAQGGRGGRGNQNYATASHQAPREFTVGTPGEIRSLVLELKTVADIGLVGYPNAGKSTLLRALTAAKPKVAAYPFTTLNPLIGTLKFENFTSLRIADIPGLIDGAHEGIGLGHDFLRHIERSSFLIYVIDMAGTDGRQPVDDYHNLRKELRLHDEQLDHRPHLVVANKMDVEGTAEQLAAFAKATGEAVLPISAESGTGIAELKQTLFDWYRGRRTFLAE
jgi:GTP-binding protein